MKVFSIWDSKAEVYSQPHFIRTKGEAIRSLTEAVNQQDHSFSKHAEDYSLFEIGTWDDTTGELIPHEAKQHIVSLHELRQ